MCDASGVAFDVILWYMCEKILHALYYSNKARNVIQKNYKVTKQELFNIVFAFKKFISYFLGTKAIMHNDHYTFRWLMPKKDVKLRQVRFVLLLQEFE